MSARARDIQTAQRAAGWVLRLGILGSCGALAPLALRHGTSLDSMLFMELGQSESVALAADRALALLAPGVLAEQPELRLMCRFDDAFVAFLNGTEVARAGLGDGNWDDPEWKISDHDSRREEMFLLEGWRELLREDGDVFSVIGINRDADDGDFLIAPWLAGARHREAADAILELEAIDDLTLKP